MDGAEFTDYFAVLDKATDRVRSVVYAFIVVAITMLFYGINVFAYPSAQYTFDTIRLQAALIEAVNAEGLPPFSDEGIYLSPQQAKALYNVLGHNLAQYEQTFGQLALEPQAPSQQGPVH